jgi:putative ABC transport system substrate-binding protein
VSPPERLSQLAAELVRVNVDVIVTFSTGVAVAKRTIRTIPIVMGTSQDPVRAGFVDSLARPGENLTGVTFPTDELSGKRLELLKESIPGVSRAVILWQPSHVDNEFKGMAPGNFAILNRKRIIELAAKNRLPVISAWRIFADDGAILTYGPEISEISRRIAIYVDKILKGAKPADLPVEQPTKFEMVINLKAAKQMGLTIPPNVLARADRVIK